MTLVTNDVLYGPPNFIVDPTLGRGTHQTITAAIASASADDTIFVRPGTYTEDFTIDKSLKFMTGQARGNNSSSAIITGTVTLTAAQTTTFNGFAFNTNSATIISISDSNAIQLHFFNSNFFLSDGDCLTMDNASGVVSFNECQFNQTATDLDIYNITACAGVTFNYCQSFSGNPAVSTVASGAVVLRFSRFQAQQFTTSASGTMQIIFCEIDTGANTVGLTTAGTGLVSIVNSSFSSGTAASISVGSGTTVEARGLTVESTNSAPITGAGTFNHGPIGFSNTGNAIDTTTKTARNLIAGSISFDHGSNPVNNRIRMQGGYTENLGISYNGGTGVMSVLGADGNALSATNPGFVTLQSKASPGQFTRYIVTANQSFIDDVGVSEIVNNLFGLPTGVAYGEDLPFFIYAVTNDAETSIQFMISRMVGARVSPAAADIGAPDDAVADKQLSFWSIDNIDETLFNDNPCLMVGSFRMQMSSSDDWTVQSLDEQDGIGQFQENRDFTMATGTFGATASTFILPNGGTAPIFTTNLYTWRVLPEGLVSINVRLTGDGGTDGSGSVVTYIIAPYVPIQMLGTSIGPAFLSNSTYTVTANCTVPGSSSDKNYFFLHRNGAISGVLHSDFGNGSRFVDLDSVYRMSKTS